MLHVEFECSCDFFRDWVHSAMQPVVMHRGTLLVDSPAHLCFIRLLKPTKDI